jgi:hypothetical protein
MVGKKTTLNPQANTSWSYDGWNKAPTIAKLAGAFDMNKNLA